LLDREELLRLGRAPVVRCVADEVDAQEDAGVVVAIPIGVAENRPGFGPAEVDVDLGGAPERELGAVEGGAVEAAELVRCRRPGRRSGVSPGAP
jgi:hypothetical protein